MSKRSNKQHERQQQRRRTDEYGDLVPSKMLGKMARMGYGSGASRLSHRDVDTMMREAQEEKV